MAYGASSLTHCLHFHTHTPTTHTTLTSLTQLSLSPLTSHTPHTYRHFIHTPHIAPCACLADTLVSPVVCPHVHAAPCPHVHAAPCPLYAPLLQVELALKLKDDAGLLKSAAKSAASRLTTAISSTPPTPPPPNKGVVHLSFEWVPDEPPTPRLPEKAPLLSQVMTSSTSVHPYLAPILFPLSPLLLTGTLPPPHCSLLLTAPSSSLLPPPHCSLLLASNPLAARAAAAQAMDHARRRAWRALDADFARHTRRVQPLCSPHRWSLPPHLPPRLPHHATRSSRRRPDRAASPHNGGVRPRSNPSMH